MRSGSALRGVLLGIGLMGVGLPALAGDAASVVQDSCVIFNETAVQGPSTRAEIFFSIVNMDLPPICDLHMQPLSPATGCVIQTCAPALGWSCQLGGGGAVWMAGDPTACIPPSGVLHGFSFIIDPGSCCYHITFTGALGEPLLTADECFSCTTVGVDKGPWGRVKKLFR